MLKIVLTNLMLIGFVAMAFARDDGKYAQSPLKSWFDSLQSEKGMCCSMADGQTVEDPDWGTANGHYWVVIDNLKYEVPNTAIVKVPNKFGRAVVWPYMEISENGSMQKAIRCFLPGAEG
jgi:hypothetical protein